MTMILHFTATTNAHESRVLNNDITPQTRLKEGDHVYTWCKYGPVSKAYTHHGIVIEVKDSDTSSILDLRCVSSKVSSGAPRRALNCDINGYAPALRLNEMVERDGLAAATQLQ